MKSDSLLKIITFSDVRKNLLLKILKEPLSLTELKERFKVTSSNLIPRIKELENKNLVVRDDGKYRLTSTGMIVARWLYMEDNLIGLLEENGRFFNEHDLTPIPDYLLDRIGELGKCKLIENSVDDLSATHHEVFAILQQSNYIAGISPVFDTSYPEFFLSIAQEKIPVSLILTDKIVNKVETEYSNALQTYLTCDNAKMYAINDVRLALVITDTFLAISLYKNCTIDTSIRLMSFEKSAINWGKELFEYYKQSSKEIKSQQIPTI